MRATGVDERRGPQDTHLPLQLFSLGLSQGKFILGNVKLILGYGMVNDSFGQGILVSCKFILGSCKLILCLSQLSLGI